MGVTIHYRGSIDDLSRVEDFEDRVIDLALAMGGNVRLWRTADEATPERMVRGLILDLAPGQEPTTLLLSPEGWLINLVEIEEAEKGQIAEPPWCSVKTQFGPVEGHVALVELLSELKARFFSNLEVHDEGSYWEHRDVKKLKANLDFLGRAINALAAGLEQHPLTAEAAEDPDILMTRIERVAAQVHQILARPAEHPPVMFPEDAGAPPDPEENERRWDELFQENRRRQEQMERSMQERLLRGADIEDALDETMEQMAPFHPDDNEEDAEHIAELAAWEHSEEDEPWSDADDLEPVTAGAEDSGVDLLGRKRHPLQEQATKLLLDLGDATRHHGRPHPQIDLALRNACEITGGLAQVHPLPPAYELDDMDVGMGLTQLKRALRGAAFVAGALFLLRDSGVIDKPQFELFHNACQTISGEIISLMKHVRESQTS
jgi:hypothetical protein